MILSKKFWRHLATLAAAVLLGFGGIATTSAAAPVAAAETSVAINAKAALAIDEASGKVLYAKNADTPLPIASMTKMISIYLVLQAIKNGDLKWTDTLTPDSGIYKISQDTSLSNVPLRADGKYTVKELYQASLIYSANAAMMLLGNGVAGTQVKFVDMMRDQLKKWRINDATIVNATGLTNNALTADRYPGTGENDQNTMTAKDLAQVAQHLLKDFPEVLDTTSIPTMTFRAGTSDATRMDSFDWMLKGLISARTELPVDGLKTGTTDAAGDCFTGTVKKDGHRIITVVMHANGSKTTRRFDETTKLMSYALNNWKQMTVLKKGQAIKGATDFTVPKGNTTSLKAAADKTITLWVPKSTTAQDITIATKKTAIVGKKNELEAPVKKGTTVAGLTITVKGDTLGYVNGGKTETASVKLAHGTAKANFFVLLFRGIGDFFSNLF